MEVCGSCIRDTYIGLKRQINILRVRNLIVLRWSDNFMLTTGKESSITNLLIEGNDHKYLSEIILNQNIYYY